jgi:hypothetical protein
MEKWGLPGLRWSLPGYPPDYILNIFILILSATPAHGWNDHYDEEDDAWVMKIFFPIIAILITLCLGSCCYVNYFKKQSTEESEDQDVDRHEGIYTLDKPDRPYLTPHYQRRQINPQATNQTSAYDNNFSNTHFRPNASQGAHVTPGGQNMITASNAYQSHNPTFGQNPYQQRQNPYQHHLNQQQQQHHAGHKAHPTQAYEHHNNYGPMRSHSFQLPPPYSQHDPNERSKSLWDMPQNGQKQQPKSGRSSPMQSTRSAPAQFGGLRRTYSTPNLTPSGSLGSVENGNNPDNRFGNGQSWQNWNPNVKNNYGGYQRTPSPQSSDSTYLPTYSDVGSTAPLFGRRSRNVYEAHTPSMGRSNHGFNAYQDQDPSRSQSYNQQQNHHSQGQQRSYEMEDIYGGGRQYNFDQNNQFNRYNNNNYNNNNHNNNNNFNHNFNNNNNFNNHNNQYGQFNQQQSAHQGYDNGAFDSNQIYEHLTPRQPINQQQPQQNQFSSAHNFYSGGSQLGGRSLPGDPINYDDKGGSYAYDPYNSSNLPGM